MENNKHSLKKRQYVFCKVQDGTPPNLQDHGQLRCPKNQSTLISRAIDDLFKGSEMSYT